MVTVADEDPWSVENWATRGFPDDLWPLPRSSHHELLGSDEAPNSGESEHDGPIGIAMGLGSFGQYMYSGS